MEFGAIPWDFMPPPVPLWGNGGVGALYSSFVLIGFGLATLWITLWVRRIGNDSADTRDSLVIFVHRIDHDADDCPYIIDPATELALDRFHVQQVGISHNRSVPRSQTA